MILPRHKCECSLTHYGPEHPYFEESVIENVGDQWISDVQRDAAKKNRSAWVLHWYPDNMVGSYILAAHDLAPLLHFIEHDVDYQAEPTEYA